MRYDLVGDCGAGKGQARLDTADGVNAGPNVNGIKPPHGAGIAVPSAQESVNIGPQQGRVDKCRAIEDVAVGERGQLGAELGRQPSLDRRSKADAIDPRYDRLREIASGEQAQDPLPLAVADLVAIRQLERELDDPSINVGYARFDRVRHRIAVGHRQHGPEIAGEDIGQKFRTQRSR